MGGGRQERLVQEEWYCCRTYAPVGGHRDLLAYLVRRLLENGANSSFVHQLADTDKSDADLLADPVERIEAIGGTPHPSIPLPRDLFQPERLNSAGMDLDDRDILAIVQAKVRAEVAVEMPAPDHGEAAVERAGAALDRKRGGEGKGVAGL